MKTKHKLNTAVSHLPEKNSSGLPKAKVFGQSQSFSLFGLRLWPPKFKSKYSAFGIVLNMSFFKLKFELQRNLILLPIRDGVNEY